MLGDQHDRLEQLDQLLVAELRRLGPERGDQVAEARRGLLFARYIPLPRTLHRVEARMHVVERVLEPFEVEFHRALERRRLGEQAVELVVLPDFLDQRRRGVALGERVESLAQQRLVDRLRALAHLALDPVAQRLRRGEPLDVGRVLERLDQARRRPPDRLRRRQLRRHLAQRIHCRAHLLQSRRRSTQPGEQPALEERALRLNVRRQLLRTQGFGSRVRGRRPREIREEQVPFGTIGLALQGGQFAVRRKQAQRLVRLAALQPVDELL